MKDISITEKLILYFVCLGVVAIVITGVYSYSIAKKALLDRTFDQLTSLRLEKKNRIEQFFLDRERDINLISKSSEISKITGLLNSGAYDSDDIEMILKNSYLINYICSYGYYHRFHVIGKNNISLDFSTKQPHYHSNIEIDTLADRNLLEFCNEIGSSKKTMIHDFTKTQILIYIGTPIIDENNNILGYVVLEIPVEAINKIMFGYSKNNGLGKTGETYLVGNDYLMRSNSRFKENAVLNIKVETQSVINALKGQTGTGIVDDYREISTLSSYSKANITGLNWVIIAEIDEQEAMIPINSIRNSILLIIVIISAVVFVFAFFLSGKIARPLKSLQKASAQVGSGNYQVQLPVKSHDEIGMLTASFNTMTMQLKKQSEVIEEEKSKQFSSLIDGQEMERQRLSRDLHDSLGQSVLAVKIKLEQAKTANPEKNQLIIQETQELLKEVINEIRSISNDLMPPVLEAFGIEQALKTLCKETSANTGTSISFSFDGIPETMNRKLKIYLYRISQEAINNITKHASATNASISINCSSESLNLCICDNGIGFDTAQKTISGNGLMNIKQRVELLKGDCEITSSPEKGTRINIVIPISS